MILIPHAALLATIIPGVLGVLIYIFQRYIKDKAGWISVVGVSSSIFLILSMTNQVLDGYYNGNGALIYLYPWIPPINVNFGFFVDMVSFPIGLIIAVISAISCFYSIEYMKKEENKPSYYANLLIFTTGMIGVIFSINLVQFYLFWELMLIPSYILISQWGISKRKLSISFKYFIYTHLGALFMLLGILSLYSYTLTFNLAELVSKVSSIPPSMSPIIFTLLLLGFFVKMAAFPLHTWLPDAHSEAPTPISAMLSGIMLKTGAYGIGRILLTIFGLRMIQASDYMLTLSLITIIYGSLMALAQTDIKRLLAYSSISQMGYIIFGFASVSELGITGSLLHIVNHAICKSLLFLCAGSIIHQTKTRNLNKISGLITKMPITGLACIIGIFSLAGTPPLNAFWSEWMIFGGGLASGKIIYSFIGVVSTILTVGYLLLFAWKVFFGSLPKRFKNITESPPLLLIPILILTSFTIILGIWPGLVLQFIAPAAEILSNLLYAS